MMHQEAFSEAHPEVRTMIAQENSVVVEWVFHGKNTGHIHGCAPYRQDRSPAERDPDI